MKRLAVVFTLGCCGLACYSTARDAGGAAAAGTSGTPDGMRADTAGRGAADRGAGGARGSSGGTGGADTGRAGATSLGVGAAGRGAAGANAGNGAGGASTFGGAGAGNSASGAGGAAGLGAGGSTTQPDPCPPDHGGCDPLVSCTLSGSQVQCGACPSGYADPHGDGTLCSDIDECASANGGCDPLVTCSNSVGSRSCGACPAGYRGDGVGTGGCARVWMQRTLSVHGGVSGLAIDATGNVYLAGDYVGALDGNSEVGGDDMFVIKYDGAGQRQWIRQLGSSKDDRALGVAIDASDNVYVAGMTNGEFVPGHVPSDVEDNDAFLVKLDATGQEQWRRQLGTLEPDDGNAVAIDASGNVVVAGDTKGAIDGGDTAGIDTIELFVAKYDPAGQQLWLREPRRSISEDGRSIRADESGNMYVLANSGAILKYDAAGQLVSVRDTSAAPNGLDFVLDASGNAYVTGFGSSDIDGKTHTGFLKPSIAKYDGSGHAQWAHQLGVPEGQAGLSDGIVSDGKGHLFVAYAIHWYDDVTPTDIFVLEYDEAGNVL